MSGTTINLEATLKQSWTVFTENAAALIVGMLILVFGTAFSLGIAGPALMLGFTKMCLRASRGETIEIGDIGAGFSAFVPSFILAIVMGIAISVGFMMLLIPGIVLSVIWSFAFYFLADGEAGPMEALGGSYNLVKDNASQLLVAILVAAVISMVGSIVPFGGLITTPIAMVMLSIVYDAFARGAAHAEAPSAASAL